MVRPPWKCQYLLSYSKTSNKNVQLVLQHCCKTSWKSMLPVLLATFKLVLQTIQVFERRAALYYPNARNRLNRKGPREFQMFAKYAWFACWHSIDRYTQFIFSCKRCRPLYTVKMNWVRLIKFHVWINCRTGIIWVDLHEKLSTFSWIGPDYCNFSEYIRGQTRWINCILKRLLQLIKVLNCLDWVMARILVSLIVNLFTSKACK